MGDPVSNTFAALQSAYNTVKGIADLNETHAVKVQLGELQAQIFSAQQSALAAQADQAALARRVDELEQLIAQMETWDAEKQRYQLTDFGAGTFAYAVKAGMENDEPPHRLCAACFQKNEKSILQFRSQNAYSQDVYDCPACKTDFRFGVVHDAPSHTDYDGEDGGWMAR